MKRSFILRALLVAIPVSFLFSSCKKNDANTQPPADSDLALNAIRSNQIASQVYGDVFNISMGIQTSDAGETVGIGAGSGIIYKPGGSESTLGTEQCFTVSVDNKQPGVFPKTATFDFGTGCTGVDGKVRKGKIIVTLSGPVFQNGSQLTTTFDGYQVDSFAVEGTCRITNLAAADHFAFKEEVIDGKLTNTNSGFWREYAGALTFTQTDGMTTPLVLSDDAYSITGSANGGNSDNFTWTGEITAPVVHNLNCSWPGKGVITFNWNQNPDSATLDYGDGSCDNKATLNYKGYTLNITL